MKLKEKKRKEKHKYTNSQIDELSVKNTNIKNISSDMQLQKIKENLKINYIFYIVLLCCLFILSRCKIIHKSFLCILISFITVSIISYIGHKTSHSVNYTENYKNLPLLIKNIPGISKICYMIDFHRQIHHDTSINKQWKNIVYEFIHNLIFQGFGIILISKFLNYLDNRMLIIWGLSYATIHNINYNIIHPTCHRDHHINDKTNYGIDIYDIIFDTKYDLNDLENYNHYSINLIIITGLIMFLTNYLYKKN